MERELVEQGLKLAGDLTIEAKLGNTVVAEFKLLSDINDGEQNRIGMRYYPVEGVDQDILLGVILGVISEITSSEKRLLKKYYEGDTNEN